MRQVCRLTTFGCRLDYGLDHLWCRLDYGLDYWHVGVSLVVVGVLQIELLIEKISSDERYKIIEEVFKSPN
jgi:hypothetical protein